MILAHLAGLALVSASALPAQQTARFGACDTRPVPGYDEVSLRSVYVPMPDGVRVAVDVMLPKNLARGAKLPTVMSATRYWRAEEGTGPSDGDRVPPSDQFWVSHGYAVVAADVRGTGASFGRWSSVWSPNEVKDLGSLIDWIVAQPWSDGRIGAIGNSYTANTAQLAAATGRPALKAVLPKSMDLDLYAQEIVPGGAWVVPLAREWTAFVGDLDHNVKRAGPGPGAAASERSTAIATTSSSAPRSASTITTRAPPTASSRSSIGTTGPPAGISRWTSSTSTPIASRSSDRGFQFMVGAAGSTARRPTE